ncbi:hypothetical protein BGX21_010349 [Mortierella sp. AD011]|nr:hypothetical protein BGX21_010349 [Mortierella sp. AD011]
MLCCISPDLTLTEALCFISVKIEGAYKLKADGNYASAIILCNEIDSQLSRLSRKATKDLNSSSSSVDQSFCGEIAGAYKKNGKLWDELERHDRAEACYSKAKKWKCFYESGNNNQESHIRAFDLVNTLIRRQRQAPVGIAKIPSEIFPCNETEHVLDYPLPEPDDRLQDTNHLVYCLLLLPNPSISDNDRHRILNEKQLNWSHDTVDNQEEMDRLNGLAKGLVDAYINNELKDEAAIAEVTLLAPVLNCELFKKLFMTFFSAFSDESTLLDVSMLKGLSCMVQGAPPGHLESDDLKKVLNALTKFLNRVCKDSSWYVYSLTLAVSHVLDAMADNHVKGLKDEDMQSLLLALKSLNKHPDPYVVFQAEYAVQALRFVPSDKTPLQAVLKGSGILLGGVVKLAIAVNGIDIEGIIDGLTKVHAGLSGAYDACMKGYEGLAL